MLSLTIHCSTCSTDFAVAIDDYRKLGLESLPKSCPTCIDRRQERPDVTISREIMYESEPCRVTSFPPVAWSPVIRDSDPRSSWHAVIRGVPDGHGGGWSGRLDLWCHDRTPEEGDPALNLLGATVRLEVMKVTKEIAACAWWRPTMEHGTVSGSRQVPIGTTEENKLAALAAAGLRLDADQVGPVTVRQEIRTYARILLCEDDPGDRELVWVVAHTKTTLKGFGRQYWASLYSDALWDSHFSRFARETGRFRDDAVLAIVDPDHPIRIVKTGDIAGEERYPSAGRPDLVVESGNHAGRYDSLDLDEDEES